MTKHGTVTLLCSGFGLGLYVPGLLVARRLQRLGVRADVCVFENVLLPDKLEQVLRSKQACHRSFPFAQFSAKMPMDMTRTVDEEALDALLDGWAAEGRRDFLVFSGHWLHVVNRYRDKVFPETVNAEIVYVDCGLPPSWTSLKHFEPDYAAGYRETWIYDTETMKLSAPIAVNEAPPLSYRDREHRFVIHGGGWGMGTYQSKIPELRERGIPLDIVVYETGEAAGGGAEDRYFMMDPSWSPWHRDEAGSHIFPPFGEVVQGKPVRFAHRDSHHELFDITGKSRGIIGKPGAGTMIDSLASATPLIMLEPFGEHERRNTEMWATLGFGVSYEQWKQADYSLGMLERLHENLMAARGAHADFAAQYRSYVG